LENLSSAMNHFLNPNLRLPALLLAPFTLFLGFVAGDEPAGSGLKELEGLLAGLASADRTEEERADQALEKLCLAAGRPGAESERRALAAALSRKLGPETPEEARLLLLNHLQAIGRDESVAALARLLGEKESTLLFEGARRALEANPTPQAVRALRKALPGSQGERRAALIQSLGARKDSLSVELLLEDARGQEPAVRFSALEALARIGDRAASDVFDEALAAGGPDLERVKSAYLKLAESMGEGDEGGAARRIYLRALQMDLPRRCAGLVGLGKAGLPSDGPLLLDALGDADPQVRGAARDGLSVVRQGTRVIAGALPRASGEIRRELYSVLARRTEPAAAPLLEKGAADPDEKVRLSAVEGLGRAGDEKAVGPLVKALADSSGPVREAAEKSLQTLKGDRVSPAIEPLLSTSPGPVRAALLRALSGRGGPSLEARAARWAGDPDPAVRSEAYLALGRAGGRSSLGPIIEGLKREEGGPLEAAERAAAAFREPESTEMILAALGGVAARTGAERASPARAALLSTLSGRAGPRVLQALKAALGDADPRVKLAALRALARSEDQAAFPLLEEALHGAGGEARAIALQGAVRFAERMAKSGGPEGAKRARAIYVEVLRDAPAKELAKETASESQNQARLEALQGLGEVGEPESLEAVRPHLKSPELGRAAARTILAIAARLPAERKAEAVTLLKEVLAAKPDRSTARECQRILRRMGVEVELARNDGMVTSWWLLGPIPDQKGDLLKTSLPPESQVDLEKEVTIGSVPYRWKPSRSDDPLGALDLALALGAGDRRGAYLYAEVEAAEATEGLFKLGSDDEVACFLNGARVHLAEGDRGLTLDQDVVKVTLRKGPNRILLKVVNHTGGWEACLRITDRNGKPLPFKQREA
jgi:HEAT repeat protein